VRVSADDAQPGSTGRELDSGAAPAARARQRAPAAPVDRLEEQELHLAAAGIARQDPRRNHARVVDDEAITRSEQVGKLGEAVVLEAAACAVDDEQPRRIAGRRGGLRDQLGRQLVVEVRELHEPSVYMGALPLGTKAESADRPPAPRRSPGLRAPCAGGSATRGLSVARWSGGAR